MKGLFSIAGSSLLASSLVAALPTTYERMVLDNDKRQGGSDCDAHEIFAPREYIGERERGGGAHCVSKWKSGVLPNKVEARADENMLRWIKISYTDGSTTEHGGHVELDSHGRGGIVSWDPYSEAFGKFSIAGDGWNGGVGRIVLEVPSGSMDVGAYDKPNLKDIPRGNNGVLLGFEMAVGDGIDWIAPIFSDAAIDTILLVDNVFSPTTEEINALPFEERMMTISKKSHFHRNKLSTPVNIGVSLTIDAQTMTKVSEVKEKGSQITHGFGLGISGKLEFSTPGPKIASAEIGGELSYSYSDMRSESTLKGEENGKVHREMVVYPVDAPAAPNMLTICTATLLQSHVDLSFESTLQYQFKNGKKYDYKVSGRYENAAYSEVESECTEKPLNDSVDGGRDNAVEIDASGSYCPNGEKVSESMMETGELKAACADKLS